MMSQPKLVNASGFVHSTRLPIMTQERRLAANVIDDDIDPYITPPPSSPFTVVKGNKPKTKHQENLHSKSILQTLREKEQDSRRKLKRSLTAVPPTLEALTPMTTREQGRPQRKVALKTPADTIRDLPMPAGERKIFPRSNNIVRPHVTYALSVDPSLVVKSFDPSVVSPQPPQEISLKGNWTSDDKNTKPNTGSIIYDPTIHSHFPYHLVSPMRAASMRTTINEYLVKSSRWVATAKLRAAKTGKSMPVNREKVLVVTSSFDLLCRGTKNTSRERLAYYAQSAAAYQVNLTFSLPGPRDQALGNVALGRDCYVFINGISRDLLDVYLSTIQEKDPSLRKFFQLHIFRHYHHATPRIDFQIVMNNHVRQHKVDWPFMVWTRPSTVTNDVVASIVRGDHDQTLLRLR